MIRWVAVYREIASPRAMTERKMKETHKAMSVMHGCSKREYFVERFVALPFFCSIFV